MINGIYANQIKFTFKTTFMLISFLNSVWWKETNEAHTVIVVLSSAHPCLLKLLERPLPEHLECLIDFSRYQVACDEFDVYDQDLLQFFVSRRHSGRIAEDIFHLKKHLYFLHISVSFSWEQFYYIFLSSSEVSDENNKLPCIYLCLHLKYCNSIMNIVTINCSTG